MPALMDFTSASATRNRWVIERISPLSAVLDVGFLRFARRRVPIPHACSCMLEQNGIRYVQELAREKVPGTICSDIEYDCEATGLGFQFVKSRWCVSARCLGHRRAGR